ncbi:MAG TPA: protein translocase subunit SecD [Pyrinomonadaceae bacterium]|nr:protein translocase subunit SecD [Pyrinomonadaceae bacterium]
MKKNLTARFVIILLVTVGSLYAVVGPRRMPRVSDFTWGGIKQNMSENIRLGLDLRGGSHLVMQVQVPQYLKRLTENNVIAVQEAAKAASLQIKEARADVDINAGRYNLVVAAADASKVNEVRDELQRRIDLSPYSDSVSGDTITWTMTPTAQRALGDQAVEQGMQIIDSRINAVGVAEPTLQRHGATGAHQILLQMPGERDPQRIKNLLAGESRLELAKVVGSTSPMPITTYDTKEAAEAAVAGQPNRRVLPYAERDEPTAAGEAPQTDPNAPTRWVVVENPPVVTGDQLRSAEASEGRAGGGGYEINFSLKPAAAEKFGQWTAANVNAYMAIVLNDRVQSAPFIKSQITDSGQITGSFTEQSAKDLALTLRSGALPAPLVYLEERTVGPSLGADSIRSGVIASIAGLIMVVLFMVIYYRGAGVNAVIALLLNMIITIAALVVFDAALTLPGIAGLILGIGMAVDSNVLIFERIREELETGKTVASSVEQGFNRAFLTIIDTHVTTIVAALFLFIFGTTLIRGFAVTLTLGLLANLFSAVYVSRTIFIWLLSRKGRRAETLSI